MDPQELRKKLSSGVIAFPITPFKADYSLDLEGVRSNLREMLKHPLAAIVAPAGTGEVFSLSPAEHLAVVKATIEEVGGKVPVLTATGFNTAIGVELARQAQQAGVNGLLLFPPYYPHADDAGLIDYYSTLAKATPLGTIVYSRDWVNPSTATVEKLAASVPNLIAWKDGTGDVRKYQQLMQRVGDRLAWIGGVGDDQVPGYYSIGVRTYTSSIAVVAPRLSLELHKLASNGDYASLKKLMNEYVIPLYVFRQRRRGYEVSVMKEMMMQIGLVAGPVRPPLLDPTPEEKVEIRALVERYKPWL
jgi:5-dehydro-4-deoxyglucarate dehydratase